MLIFCAIATPCPRAPTSCNPFVCRSTMTCTPAQPHLLVAAHNFCRVEITKKVMDAADINKTFFVQRTTGERIHGTAIAAIALHAAGPAASYFANIVPSLLPLPCLACHVATHHAVPCCAGRAPSFRAWYRTPREPSARPARPTAIHRSPWLLFSFPLSSCWLRSFYFQLFVVCLLSIEPAIGRFGFSGPRRATLQSVPPTRPDAVVALAVHRAVRGVCRVRFAGSHERSLSVCFRSLLLSVAMHHHTLNTPHHIHTTPQPLITHNHLHPSHYHRLALAHASLRWHSVPVDALCA